MGRSLHQSLRRSLHQSLRRSLHRSLRRSIASIITLNLGVGCAPSCWPIFGFRNLLGARRGAEGSFLCSLITDFLAEGAGWGASPGRGGELGCQGVASVLKKIVGLHRFFLRSRCLKNL